MSRQTPPPAAAPADGTHPVIVRTSSARVYLGRLAAQEHVPTSESRSRGYGPQLTLIASRPLYQWPSAGLHVLAASADTSDLTGVRLGPPVLEQWFTDVRVIWALTEDAYRALDGLTAAADVVVRDPRPSGVFAPLAAGVTAAEGTARVARALQGTLTVAAVTR